MKLRLRPGALPLILLILTGETALGGGTFCEGRHGPASLTLVAGVPILHVYGTPQQMGEQQGALLGPQFKAVVKSYLNRVLLPGGKDTGLRARVLRLSRQMEKSIPPQYVREMQALAKAAGADYDDVLLANTVFDLQKALFCSTLVAVGKRSADSQPIFGRNLDFPTFGVAHRFSCVVVTHPKDGRSVASVTFPGMVGVLSGLSDAGIAVAVMQVRSGGARTGAMPYAMLFRMALAGAESTDDVLKVLKDNKRSTSNNLMICDAKGRAACAELTIEKIAVRRPTNGVIYSTNHFRSKELGGWRLCWRVPRIKKALRGDGKVDAALVKKTLQRVALGKMNLQSMIFRPGSRNLLLAIGEPPAAKRPFVLLEQSVLFPTPRKPQ